MHLSLPTIGACCKGSLTTSLPRGCLHGEFEGTVNPVSAQWQQVFGVVVEMLKSPVS